MSRICIPTPASTFISSAVTIGGGATPLTTPDSNIFRVDTNINSLTGASNSLASLLTADGTYPVGICIFLPSLTTPATYQLVNGTEAENSPFIIRPNDFNPSTNAKVWKQRM